MMSQTRVPNVGACTQPDGAEVLEGEEMLNGDEGDTARRASAETGDFARTEDARDDEGVAVAVPNCGSGNSLG